nr:MAG TPA: hypothetical protein [Bacteriophage sp.]
MAVTKKTDMAAEKKETAKQAPQVSLYSVEELAEAKERFQANAVIIKAALKQQAKQFYSMEEAENIINRFKNKEVK